MGKSFLAQQHHMTNLEVVIPLFGHFVKLALRPIAGPVSSSLLHPCAILVLQMLVGFTENPEILVVAPRG